MDRDDPPIEVKVKIEEHYIKEEPSSNEVVACHVVKEAQEEDDSDVTALKELVEQIKPDLYLGKTYDMEELLALFKVAIGREHLFGSHDGVADETTLDWLEQNLKTYFKDLLQIVNISHNRPKLVALSLLNIQNELNALADIKKTLRKVEALSESSYHCDLVTPERLMFWAAQMLRSYIADQKKTTESLQHRLASIGSCDQYTLIEKIELDLQKDLYNFFYWTIVEKCPSFEENINSIDVKSIDVGLHKRIIQLIQMLLKFDTEVPHWVNPAGAATLIYNGSKHCLTINEKCPPPTLDALKDRIKEVLNIHPDAPLGIRIHDHLSGKYVPLPQSFLKLLIGAELMIHTPALFGNTPPNQNTMVYTPPNQHDDTMVHTTLDQQTDLMVHTTSDQKASTSRLLSPLETDEGISQLTDDDLNSINDYLGTVEQHSADVPGQEDGEGGGYEAQLGEEHQMEDEEDVGDEDQYSEEEQDVDEEQDEEDDFSDDAIELTMKRARAGLPKPYVVPVNEIPPHVRKAASDGKPLSRVQISTITTALYIDVTRYVLYPSPKQYDEVVRALLLAMPGLARLHDLPPRRIHNLWKTRLQYKFRNCRRRRNKNSTVAPLLDRHRRVRHWRSISTLLTRGETLYSVDDSSSSADAGAGATSAAAGTRSGASADVAAAAAACDGLLSIPPEPINTANSASNNNKNGQDEDSDTDYEGTDYERVCVRVSFGSGAVKEVFVGTRNLSLDRFHSKLRKQFHLHPATAITVAVFEELLRIYRPVVESNLLTALHEGALFKLVLRHAVPRSTKDKDKGHYLVEEGILDPLPAGDDTADDRLDAVGIRSCIRNAIANKVSKRRSSGYGDDLVEKKAVRRGRKKRKVVDRSRNYGDSDDAKTNQGSDDAYPIVSPSTEAKVMPDERTLPGQVNAGIAVESVEEDERESKFCPVNVLDGIKSHFDGNSGSSAADVCQVELVKMEVDSIRNLEVNQKDNSDNSDVIESKDSLRTVRKNVETSLLNNSKGSDASSRKKKTTPTSATGLVNGASISSNPGSTDTCLSRAASPVLSWPQEFRLPVEVFPLALRTAVNNTSSGGPLSGALVPELLEAVSRHCRQYTRCPTEAQCGEVVGALFAALPSLPRLGGLTPHRAFNVWRRRLLQKFGHDTSDGDSEEEEVEYGASPAKAGAAGCHSVTESKRQNDGLSVGLPKQSSDPGNAACGQPNFDPSNGLPSPTHPAPNSTTREEGDPGKPVSHVPLANSNDDALQRSEVKPKGCRPTTNKQASDQRSPEEGTSGGSCSHATNTGTEMKKENGDVDHGREEPKHRSIKEILYKQYRDLYDDEYFNGLLTAPRPNLYPDCDCHSCNMDLNYDDDDDDEYDEEARFNDSVFNEMQRLEYFRGMKAEMEWKRRGGPRLSAGTSTFDPCEIIPARGSKRKRSRVDTGNSLATSTKEVNDHLTKKLMPGKITNQKSAGIKSDDQGKKSAEKTVTEASNSEKAALGILNEKKSSSTASRKVTNSDGVTFDQAPVRQGSCSSAVEVGCNHGASSSTGGINPLGGRDPHSSPLGDGGGASFRDGVTDGHSLGDGVDDRLSLGDGVTDRPPLRNGVNDKAPMGDGAGDKNPIGDISAPGGSTSVGREASKRPRRSLRCSDTGSLSSARVVAGKAKKATKKKKT